MNYFKKLQLDFNPFDDLPAHYYEPELHNKLNVAAWNKWIEPMDLNNSTQTWFRDNNIEPHSCMFFSYLPRSSGIIHSDGYDTGDHDNRPLTAINFYRGGSGMLQWFRVKDTTKALYGNTEVATSAYIKHSISDVESVGLYTGTGPVLVDTDTPHRGVNFSNEMRYCITLRWRPVLTVAQALEKFSQYLTNK